MANRDEGSSQGDAKMPPDYCSSCGDQLVDGKRYCPNCGARRADGAMPTGMPREGAPAKDDEASTPPWYLVCPDCDSVWMLNEREAQEQACTCEDCGSVIPVADGSLVPPEAALGESRPTPWYVVCPSCARVWELNESEAQESTYVCEECGWSMAVAEGSPLDPTNDPSPADESEGRAPAPPPPTGWSPQTPEDRGLPRTLLVLVAMVMVLLVAFLLSRIGLGL